MVCRGAWLRGCLFKRLGRGLYAFASACLCTGVSLGGSGWQWGRPGLPPVKNGYDSELAEAANQLAARWHKADLMGLGVGPKASASFAASDIQAWSTDQVRLPSVHNRHTPLIPQLL